jgi:dihydrofolate synthase/folylpolyglutamate synthase
MPGHHRRRHQRQGLDLRLPRSHPAFAGYRVGCYTSPHLLAYNERCASTASRSTTSACALPLPGRGGPPGAGERGADLFRVRHAGGLGSLCRAGVEVAILEVGLGGRLDAVNAMSPMSPSSPASRSTTWTGWARPRGHRLRKGRHLPRRQAGGLRRSAAAANTCSITPPAIGAELQLIGRDFGYFGDRPPAMDLLATQAARAQ